MVIVHRWLKPVLGGLMAAGLVFSPTTTLSMQDRDERVLRVGLTNGSQPCNYRSGAVWQGLAVDLWQQVASQERLAYLFSEWPTTASLLEATRRGDVDVAIGCLNVSPERLKRYQFSLPIQEGGQALLVRRTPLALGQAIVAAVVAPELLQLLGGFLAAILLVTLLLWRIEGHGDADDIRVHGRRRSFAKVFQILATGPGTNSVATTTRGHGLVLLSYLIRIVSASLLVSYVTVNVVRAPQSIAGGNIRSLQDLGGKRVAARPGSISQQLLRKLNEMGSEPPIQIVALPQIAAAADLIDSREADAVLADDLQLEYVLQGLGHNRLELVKRGIRPESQAFSFSPQLPEAVANRIDLAISELKGSGAVAELRSRALRTVRRQ